MGDSTPDSDSKVCTGLWWKSQRLFSSQIGGIAQIDGNVSHHCTTKQLWEGCVEEYVLIKFYGFPSVLHLILVQPSFWTVALWDLHEEFISQFDKTTVCDLAESLSDCSVNAQTCYIC